MFFRRPRNSSAFINTTRPLDAYQYSHILLPTFRISNLIRLSTVAKLLLPPISRPTLAGRSTHNQYKSQSLTAGVEQAAAATAPTVPAKTVSIAATPPSGSATTRPTSAASGIGGPNPRTNPEGNTIYSPPPPIKTYQGPVHKGHKVYRAIPCIDVCEKCFAIEPTPCPTPCAADYCSSCTQVVPLHATFLLRGDKGCCQALTSEAVEFHFCCGCHSSSQYARTNCAGTGMSLSPGT
jgi:hypothetical protein